MRTWFWNTIEEKYGVEQGDDWFAVAQTAEYKRGETVTFTQGKLLKKGVVLDTRRDCQWGALQWMFLVKYEDNAIPRWTNPKWLRHPITVS